jgi:hypothetical protein
MKLEEMKCFQFTISLKHQKAFETTELIVGVEVDPSAQLVTLTLNQIDSALILDLVTRILHEEHSVEILIGAAENQKPTGSGFRLRLHFDGRYYRAGVYRLADDVYSLRVDNSSYERARMTKESERLVLKTLFEHDIEAIITGTSDGALEVFIFGSHDKHGGPTRAWDLVQVVSSVPAFLTFESDITHNALAGLLAGQYLKWDGTVNKCVEVHAPPRKLDSRSIQAKYQETISECPGHPAP